MDPLLAMGKWGVQAGPALSTSGQEMPARCPHCGGLLETAEDTSGHADGRSEDADPHLESSPSSRENAAPGGLVTERKKGNPAGVDEADRGGKRQAERATHSGVPHPSTEVTFEPGGVDREPSG